ncbi:MAG: cutinase family protein [Patulibacter sp.]|nr:cutinase family protein [Patulibacter sp.]
MTAAFALTGLAAGSASARVNVNPPLGEVPATAATVQCTPVIVYAVRGSSENSNVPAAHAPGQFEPGTTRPMTKYYMGLGEEMEPAYVLFRDTYPKGYVSLVTNRAPQNDGGLGGGTDPNGPATNGYRAVGVEATLGHPDPFVNYEQSALQGAAIATTDLNLIHARCAGSKLVLAGYSEGAEVLRRATASLSWTPAPGMAAGMIFGDVLWKASDRNVTFVGDNARDGRGAILAARDGDNHLGSPVRYAIAPIPQWPAGWNITSWCHGGDLACQWRGGTLIAHQTYGLEDAVAAAGRMARQIGGPFIKPVVTAIPLNQPRQCFVRGSRYVEQLSIAGSPAGTSATFTSQWEPFPFFPFKPVTLKDQTDKTIVRSSMTGLQIRYVVRWNGDKLDYRNVC